jgi:hypothetical protein
MQDAFVTGVICPGGCYSQAIGDEDAVDHGGGPKPRDAPVRQAGVFTTRTRRS